jgi:dTDP-glucose 4,6-dehydratase
MKTLLLTGIGGSIGFHVFCHLMHNTDWNVLGIDSFRHKGLVDRLALALEDHPEWASRLRMITHDLTAPFSEMSVQKMGKVDYIISMASLSDVQGSIDDPVPFVRNNVDICLTMLELARVLKPEAFVQISTDEVYGPATHDGQHPEWSPILPSNPYSGSKAAQEALCTAWWRTYAVPLITVNLMNNFGPCQQGNKFPVMIQRAVMAGETVKIHGRPGDIGTRFYIHSRNSADALLFILRNVTPNLHQEGQLDRPARFNIVGDKQLDNLELAQSIAGMLGKELKWEYVGASDSRPGHDSHYGLDGSKLHELGWSAPVSFEQSMADTIQWQIEHPEWMSV